MTYEAPSAQPDQPHECYSDRSETAVQRPETELNDAGSIWTDALQARLRDLWAQGLTASELDFAQFRWDGVSAGECSSGEACRVEQALSERSGDFYHVPALA